MSLLTMTRGDRREFDIALTRPDGTPLDLTGLSLTFTAKRRMSDPDDDAIIQKTTAAGIVVDDDPTTGLAVLTLEPEDTELLTDLRRLRWDVQVDDGAGDVRTPLRGQLSIAADVTRSREVGS